MTDVSKIPGSTIQEPVWSKSYGWLSQQEFNKFYGKPELRKQMEYLIEQRQKQKREFDAQQRAIARRKKS